MPSILIHGTLWSAALTLGLSTSRAEDPAPLAGTRPLTIDGDIASQLVAGADKFLLREIDRSIERRPAHWRRDTASAERYEASIEPNRKRLAHILGVRDPRVPFDGPELMATTVRPALVGRGESYDIFAVRWPAIGDVHGQGLLVVPRNRKPVADIILIPDADQTPEQMLGLSRGIRPESQMGRRLAESGCRLLLPVLISRERGGSGGTSGLKYEITHREFLYRSAYELGRHLIGYEVQKVLAAVDWYAREAAGDAKIGICGWGEGGLIALYAGALDSRVDAVCVSGYFDSRQNVWQEPVDRNVFGLLEQFGDAELASMIVPRKLVIEAAVGPRVDLPPGTRGAPGRLTTPGLADVRHEVERAVELVRGLPGPPPIELVVSADGTGPSGTEAALTAFVQAIDADARLAPPGSSPERLQEPRDNGARLQSQIREIDRHNQWLLRESPFVRKQFMARLDTQSAEKYAASVEDYRRYFHDEVIGRIEMERLPANARSRRIRETPKWTAYEVVLDVYADVMAYGILVLPKGIGPGEKRPVVVCQHGLEGRPQHVIGGDEGAYHDFAVKLAERGFVTFAPQNLYIFQDRFRTLQRKANPIKKTLFSIIVPQHQQIVDWLKVQPFVDPQRIGFYGLSYGGKSAMRIPPLVTDYCLSICSADFNEWVDKNASTRNPHSYVWTGEYEIFEFDLGSTFNYAEMAALIAPRPFMVERGHFDGVASDETVAYEFAKVRHLYAARLKIPDRCEIEWFDGPHTINGQGTFDFLHRHLAWPRERNGARE